ncbi:MAG: J domain-containing protein [Clostridia bacterium]|nr:J domain-containing protein [Clostridia bacterium]
MAKKERTDKTGVAPRERRRTSLKETRRIDELIRKTRLEHGELEYHPSEYMEPQPAGFAYRLLGFNGDVSELDFEHLCSAFRVRAIQCVDDWDKGDDEAKADAELRYWLLEGALASIIVERGWQRREIKARILPPFDPEFEHRSRRPFLQYAPEAMEDVRRLFENIRSGYSTTLLREQKRFALDLIESWYPPEEWTPQESLEEAALDPYDVLSVPRSANMEKVTRSYRKLINRVLALMKHSQNVGECERLRRIYDNAYDKIEMLNRRRQEKQE